MNTAEYREKLRAEGIDTRLLWTQHDPDQRFTLTCVGVYGPDDQWHGPIIIQEFSGDDGILTYVVTKTNTIKGDVAAILGKTGEPA